MFPGIGFFQICHCGFDPGNILFLLSGQFREGRQVLKDIIENLIDKMMDFKFITILHCPAGLHHFFYIFQNIFLPWNPGNQSKMTKRRISGHRPNVFLEDLIIIFRIKKTLADMDYKKTARIRLVFFRKIDLPCVQKEPLARGCKISFMIDMKNQRSGKNIDDRKILMPAGCSVVKGRSSIS